MGFAILILRKTPIECQSHSSTSCFWRLRLMLSSKIGTCMHLAQQTTDVYSQVTTTVIAQNRT